METHRLQNASGADFDAIHTYASFAGAAYRSNDEIMQDFPETVRINAPGRNGARYLLHISHSRSTQTISVRGTRSWADRLHDIEYRLDEEWSVGVAFHRGFETDARLIYADIKPFLNKKYRTRVTGHSLGAAVSAILMIYLIRDGYDVEPSVNFGQPKYTNAAGAEQFSELPILRVVNRNDVVPMLPPRLSSDPNHGSYSHIGEELILLEGPNCVHLTAHDAERLSVDTLWRNRSYASREDHRMVRYLDALREKQAGVRQVPFAAWRNSSDENAS